MTNRGPATWIGINYITMAAYAFVASVFTLFFTAIFSKTKNVHTIASLVGKLGYSLVYVYVDHIS